MIETRDVHFRRWAAKEIPSIPNLPELEKKLVSYWKDIDVVEEMKKSREKCEERVYYDGPITSNGLPHYGHAITWTIKDVIPRYWTMKGYKVERNMGWDCQGIPVEYEVEKELNFNKKQDIENFGVAKFNDLCRKSVEKYQDAIFEYETKLGRWFDKKAIYSTMDPLYIESVWWSLKELYKRGLLYEGHKVVAFSTRAGTTLSTHEVSEGGYSEIEDDFVTVKFKLSETENTYVLAWTTTPWTIPGNLLLAIGKKIKYVKVLFDGDNYIVAEERVKDIFKNKEYTISESVPVKDLEGKEYVPPFNYFENKRSEDCFKVVFADHANVEDGTGIVHLAPYGAEDFDVFMSLNIPLFDYLDDAAHFSDLIPEYKGMFYKDANKKIMEDLDKNGCLFDSGRIVHRMPMCWRTKTPLIYKPVKSWYVAVTKLKKRMLEENNNINWLPEYIKDGNSGMWISNARDWALSRSRYWGTPLPVWVNGKTGEKVIIGSFAELKEYSGVQITDPHKPFVDEITWEDQKNGGTFKRVPDVIDVWYDSGSMPFARHHYPFENKERFNKTMPADYIAEGPDQIRLWFYVMHVLGVALFDKVPYKNVVTIGMMLDEFGKKMSKSSRNYKSMDSVLDEYGGDILRYFVLTSSILSGQDSVFAEKYLIEARKEFFLILWNSVKYFITYADVHNFVSSNEVPDSPNILDKWILVRFQETVNKFDEYMNSYHIMEASKLLQPFVVDLSTWFIRRSRDRLKEGDQEALSTLYYVLSDFTKLIAPILPFLSESLYDILNLRATTGIKSVHLDLYPQIRSIDEKEKDILIKMKITRDIVSVALALRLQVGIKVRQPLSVIYIKPKLNDKHQNIDYFEELIIDEINVKEVKREAPEVHNNDYQTFENEDYVVWLDTKLTDDLKLEGIAREIIRKIQDLRKEEGLTVNDKVEAIFESTEENVRSVAKFNNYIKNKVLAVTLKPGKNYELKKI